MCRCELCSVSLATLSNLEHAQFPKQRIIADPLHWNSSDIEWMHRICIPIYSGSINWIIIWYSSVINNFIT